MKIYHDDPSVLVRVEIVYNGLIKGLINVLK